MFYASHLEAILSNEVLPEGVCPCAGPFIRVTRNIALAQHVTGPGEVGESWMLVRAEVGMDDVKAEMLI